MNLKTVKANRHIKKSFKRNRCSGRRPCKRVEYDYKKMVRTNENYN